MIVCVCSGLSVNDILELIGAGCISLDDIQVDHNKCNDCKSCHKDVSKIIEKLLSKD